MTHPSITLRGQVQSMYQYTLKVKSTLADLARDINRHGYELMQENYTLQFPNAQITVTIVDITEITETTMLVQYQVHLSNMKFVDNAVNFKQHLTLPIPTDLAKKYLMAASDLKHTEQAMKKVQEAIDAFELKF